MRDAVPHCNKKRHLLNNADSCSCLSSVADALYVLDMMQVRGIKALAAEIKVQLQSQGAQRQFAASQGVPCADLWLLSEAGKFIAMVQFQSKVPTMPQQLPRLWKGQCVLTTTTKPKNLAVRRHRQLSLHIWTRKHLTFCVLIVPAELANLLEVRVLCLLPEDFPLAARPAIPTFLHRDLPGPGAARGGAVERRLGEQNWADCSELAALAEQSPAQLAAARSALLQWLKARPACEPVLPAAHTGGKVTVQFRLDRRLPQASDANGAWYSMALMLPPCPAGTK